MASIADAFKQFTELPGALAQSLTSVAQTPASFASAATSSAEALQSIADKIKGGMIEQKIDRALTVAETWVALTSAAQIVGAAALVGMFILQARAPQRSRKVGLNPRKGKRRAR